MDEIASTAGTSKTVFYRHFTDRAGLYQAVAEHVDRLIIQDVTAALGRRATSLTDIDEQPRTLIAGAIDAYLELVERDPEVYRFVVSAPLLDRADPTAPADPAGDVSGHVAEQMGMVIRDALLEVGADPGPAFVWGHGLVGLVRAAADAWLAAGPDREPRSTMTGYLTTLAWSGLSCAWPTHPAGTDPALR
jgi:AcrR family transcriptional regulator